MKVFKMANQTRKTIKIERVETVDENIDDEKSYQVNDDEPIPFDVVKEEKFLSQEEVRNGTTHPLDAVHQQQLVSRCQVKFHVQVNAVSTKRSSDMIHYST